MHTTFLPAAATLLAATFVSPAPTPAGDRVIRSGETVVYDTSNGTLRLNSLTIEAGGLLRALGPQPLRIEAREIRLDGLLVVSGVSKFGVFTLNSPTQPEPGAPGGPSGGTGGVGSELMAASTPAGLPGDPAAGTSELGGAGGESSFSSSFPDASRRAAGGGGGVFGPPAPPIPLNPEHPQNQGLLALSGFDGAAGTNGALSLAPPPKGGGIGAAVFTDADPTNDFFGRKVVSGVGEVVGELAAPRAGQGGGAGGDAHRSAVWPMVPLINFNVDKGCGGGGGGGLAVLIARTIRVGSEGRLRADGGTGGFGENTAFLNHIGGGSGGGSGGMIVLQAELIDMSQAQPGAFRALGGLGGPGADDILRVEGSGGHGGPGLIQFHVPNGDSLNVLLPFGATLGQISSPEAHVLKIEPGL